MVFSYLAVLALAAAAFVQAAGHGAAEVNDGNSLQSPAFARASGTRFTIGGRPFYSNGFNAYWLMYMAAGPAGDRSKASEALEQAASLGAKLVRTWAFSDGGYRALQVSPGVYSEDVFRVCSMIRDGRRASLDPIDREKTVANTIAFLCFFMYNSGIRLCNSRSKETGCLLDTELGEQLGWVRRKEAVRAVGQGAGAQHELRR